MLSLDLMVSAARTTVRRAIRASATQRMYQTSFFVKRPVMKWLYQITKDQDTLAASPATCAEAAENRRTAHAGFVNYATMITALIV